jgi:formylglycine-generating enzyme required for sulfatase activity
MSGNVQEWTSTPVSTGVFSVRGGAFDTPAGGLTCQFSFVSFSHDFEYSNLGFRCCADP